MLKNFQLYFCLQIHLQNDPFDCILQFGQLHNCLTRLVTRIDNVLSFMILVVYILLISDLSKYVYFLADKLTKPWDGILEMVFVVTRVCHILWILVITSFTAATVATVSVQALHDLQDLTTRLEVTVDQNDPTARRNSLNNHIQLLALLLKLHVAPAYLTGWKLFVINRAFLLTVIGVVLTYSLLLIQITPRQDQSHQGNYTKT